jgi:hypothetical protein
VNLGGLIEVFCIYAYVKDRTEVRLGRVGEGSTCVRGFDLNFFFIFFAGLGS